MIIVLAFAHRAVCLKVKHKRQLTFILRFSYSDDYSLPFALVQENPSNRLVDPFIWRDVIRQSGTGLGLSITKEVINRDPLVWNEDSIHERTKLLTEEIKQIWKV